MKKFMQKLANVFTTEEYHLVVKEKWNVLDVLSTVGDCIVNCNDNDTLGSWYIDIKATDRQWDYITSKLEELGYELMIKNRPEIMYLTKKVES